MRKPAPDEEDLVLELTGTGVEQGTVDTETSLRAMLAYVEALQATARIQRQELRLTGLFVEDKCVQLRARANSQAVAVQSAEYLQGVLDERLLVPHGLAQHIERIRTSFSAVANDVCATARIGDRVIRVFQQRRRSEPVVWEIVGVEVHRAVVRRVGGAKPKVQLSTEYEGSLNASVSSDLAKRMGPLLYEEIDATLTITRDTEGNVVNATLSEFAQVTQLKDPLTEVQKWFAPAAKRWESVDDRDAELTDAD